MNRLASILPTAQVLVSVEATSKKRAFEEAGLLFESLHGLSRALITGWSARPRSPENSTLRSPIRTWILAEPRM